MEFRQFLSVIYRNRRMILTMVLSATITATLLTYVLSETYGSSTKVLIRPQKIVDIVQKRQEILNFPVSYYTPIETASKTYTEMIKSRIISERIVKSLHLDTMKEEEGSGLRYLWNKIKKDTKALLRKTWDLLRYGYLREQDAFERAVAEVQGGLTVKPTKETYLFELQAEAKSSALASAIANAAAEVFVDYLQEVSSNDMKTEKKLSEDKVALSRYELNRARSAVVTFKEREGIVSLKNEMELEVKSIAELDGTLKSVKTELGGAIARRKEIIRQLAELKKFSKSEAKVTDNPLIRTLRAHLAEKEVLVAGLRERYTEEHRELQTLRTEIEEIKRKIDREAPTLNSEETLSIDPVYQDLSLELARVETQLEALKAKSNNLALILEEKRKRIEEIPEKEAEFARLDLIANLSEDTHRLLSKEYEEVKIAADKRVPDIRVIHNAIPPLYPVRPIKVYHAGLAGILSLVVGIGIALLKEHLNLSIRSIDEAENGLALPVLMTIPYLQSLNGISSLVIQDEMVSLSHVISPSFQKAIYGLRADLQFWNSQEMSSFLVTSCGPQEGKSTIISCLAVALAVNHKKIALIDANLRFPRLHEIFDLSNEKGLSGILIENSPPCLQWPMPGLGIVASGPPLDDPSALFESDRMIQLVRSLKKEFDFVLIDSPPLLACPDSALLASIADGTILVLSTGRTSIEDGRWAKTILERAHAKILGIVLNHHDEVTGYYHWSKEYAREHV